MAEPVAAGLARGTVGDIVDPGRHHRKLLLHPWSVDSAVAAAHPDPVVDLHDRRLVDVRTSFSPLSAIPIGSAETLVPPSPAEIAGSGKRIRRDRVRAAPRHFCNWRGGISTPTLAGADPVRIGQSLSLLWSMAWTRLRNIVYAQFARTKREARPDTEGAHRIATGPAPSPAQAAFPVQHPQHRFLTHAGRRRAGRSTVDASRRSLARESERRRCQHSAAGGGTAATASLRGNHAGAFLRQGAHGLANRRGSARRSSS